MVKLIEVELRKLLTTIPELGERVSMLYAPEGTETPYAVYTMNRSEEDYILDGATGNRYVTFDINIYAKDQLKLKQIQYQVREKLLNLLGERLGDFLIQRANVNMTDFYDSAVELSRGVVEVELYI